MDNSVYFSSPVEKIVENVWKMCGKAVGKMAGFTHFFWQMRDAKWKNTKMYTIFMVACGKISTGLVNKFFVFYRYEEGGLWRFTQFPHTLLL